MALASLYYLIKNPTKPPTTQITAQFNAMYSELKKGATVPAVPIDMNLGYAEDASWLASQIGVPVLLSTLIALREAEGCKATGKAMINQITLIARYTDMTPYLTISDYLAAEPTKSVFLPGMGREAAEFVKVVKYVKDQHGENSPFAKVLALVGNEKLSSQNYPNLFTVAVRHKTRHDRMFGGYVVKKSSECKLSDEVISESLSRPLKRKSTCQAADKDHVRKVFAVDVDEVENEESRQESILARLTAGLRDPLGHAPHQWF